MNENKINIDAENFDEKIEQPIYRASFLRDYSSCCELNSVNFRRIKQILLIWLCYISFAVYSNSITKSLYLAIMISICSLIMGSLYYRAKRMATLSYERFLFVLGKEQSVNQELFDEKIVLVTDGQRREYGYSQITKLIETENLIMLHLKHNLFISLNKNTLNAEVEVVKEFLVGKCQAVKGKRFKNYSNNQKWALTFFVAQVIVSVMGLIGCFIN